MSHSLPQLVRVNFNQTLRSSSDDDVGATVPVDTPSRSFRADIGIMISPTTGGAISCRSELVFAGGPDGAGINAMESLFAKLDFYP